jgi:hypothetical protein
MEPLAILREAEQAGLKLRIEGDKLVVSGPRKAEPIVRRLAACKAEVMAALAAPPSPAPAEALPSSPPHPWYSAEADAAALAAGIPGSPSPSLTGHGPCPRGGGCTLRASPSIRCPGRTHTATWCGTTSPTISPTATSLTGGG